MASPFDEVSTEVGPAAPSASGSSPPTLSFDDVSTETGPSLQEAKSFGDNPIVSLVRGFNRGPIKAVGGLVDLVNQSPRLLNFLPGVEDVGAFSDRPVGGTDQLLDAATDLNITGRTDEEESSPFASRVGEVVGGSLPFLGAAGAAGRGAQAITKGVTAPIREAFRTAPGAFTGAELAAASTAGIGGGIAAEAFPNDPVAKIVGEMAGGLFSPAILLSRVLPGAARGVKTAIKTRTQEGREQAAGERAQEIITERGGDPAEVSATINPNDPLTPGAQTGNKDLLALEQSVLNENRRLQEAVDAGTGAALEQLQSDIVSATGAPGQGGAAQGAIRGRVDRLKEAIDTRVQQAALFARAKVDDELPDGDIRDVRQQTSIVLRDELEKALGDARTQERALWSEIGQDTSVTTQRAKEAFQAMKSDLSSSELDDLPKVARDRLGGGGDFGDETTVREMLGLRRKLLENAREARANNKSNEARISDNIASSILDDLGTLPGEEVVTASAFTRALNDRFTRGTVGRVLRTAGTGGDVITPSTTAQATIGRPGVAGREAAQDVGQALAFEGKGGPRAATGRTARGDQAQQDFLRTMALSTADAKGNVNKAALDAFLKSRADVLAEFPQLQKRLGNISEAAKVAERVAKTGAVRKSNLANRRKSRAAAFINEPPGTAFARILKSQDPEEGISQLVRMTKKDTTGQATTDLRNSLLQFIMERSRKNVGGRDVLNADQLSTELFDSLVPGSDGLVSILQREGAIGADQVKNLKKIADRARQIERQVASNIPLDELQGPQDALFDFMARVLGAQAASISPTGQAVGAPIVVAGAGSRLARGLLQKVPEQKISQILAEAVENPELMKRLLVVPKTAKQRARLERQLNAFLLDNAIVEPAEATREEEE